MTVASGAVKSAGLTGVSLVCVCLMDRRILITPFLNDDAACLSLRTPRWRDALDIQRNCFPEQTLDKVQGYLRWCIDQQAKGRMVRLVAEAEGQVVASGQLTLLRDRGEIGSLVVAEPYRQRGIGTALVLSLVEHARTHNLHSVEISASTAMPWIQAWYERLGFTFQRIHTFPGQEQVAILQLALDGHKETPCPPTQA
jgi:ribosomal protein S18 acetylase RimI-like enzyme